MLRHVTLQPDAMHSDTHDDDAVEETTRMGLVLTTCTQDSEHEGMHDDAHGNDGKTVCTWIGSPTARPTLMVRVPPVAARRVITASSAPPLMNTGVITEELMCTQPGRHEGMHALRHVEEVVLDTMRTGLTS